LQQILFWKESQISQQIFHKEQEMYFQSIFQVLLPHTKI
jgi:hypothetical protein